jgi:hypothetical protein
MLALRQSEQKSRLPKEGVRPHLENMSTASLTDLGFLEARSRLLEVAAFLDRLDRHHESADPRVEALRRSLELLRLGAPNRTEKILEILSDPTLEPLAETSGKPACGAWTESS